MRCTPYARAMRHAQDLHRRSLISFTSLHVAGRAGAGQPETQVWPAIRMSAKTYSQSLQPQELRLARTAQHPSTLQTSQSRTSPLQAARRRAHTLTLTLAGIMGIKPGTFQAPGTAVPLHHWLRHPSDLAGRGKPRNVQSLLHAGHQHKKHSYTARMNLHLSWQLGSRTHTKSTGVRKATVCVRTTPPDCAATAQYSIRRQSAAPVRTTKESKPSISGRGGRVFEIAACVKPVES